MTSRRATKPNNRTLDERARAGDKGETDALARIAARAGVPVAHVVEVYEERIAMMTEDGSMSEAAAAIAAVSDVAAVFERSER